MNIIKRDFHHFTNLSLKTNIENYELYKFYYVYFINCLLNVNYIDWLKNQLGKILKCKSKIYIECTILKNETESFINNLNNILKDIEFEINFYYEEEHEYRGILKVWELSQKYNSKNDIICYFHSKKISVAESYQDSHLNILFEDINKIKEIFDIFEDIDKIGYASGGVGWIWFNFWYARGSYLKNLEKPLKTTRRYYYEDWLCRVVESKDVLTNRDRCHEFYKNTLDNCYNLVCDPVNEIGNIGCHLDTSNKNFILNEMSEHRKRSFNKCYCWSNKIKLIKCSDKDKLKVYNNNSSLIHDEARLILEKFDPDNIRELYKIFKNNEDNEMKLLEDIRCKYLKLPDPKNMSNIDIINEIFSIYESNYFDKFRHRFIEKMINKYKGKEDKLLTILRLKYDI